MSDYYFQQFSRLARAKLVVYSLGISSAFLFIKVAVIPCARSIIIFLVSSLPSLWIAIRAWLSPLYIYIILNLIILAIAAQNNPTTKNKLTQKTTRSQSQEKEEILYFSTENSPRGPSLDACRTKPEEKLDNQKEKSNDDGNSKGSGRREPVLDTLEEAWKMITEAQGKGHAAPDGRRREEKVSERLKRAAESESGDEKSMNEDELNQRVEDFIRKFKQ